MLKLQIEVPKSHKTSYRELHKQINVITLSSINTEQPMNGDFNIVKSKNNNKNKNNKIDK